MALCAIRSRARARRSAGAGIGPGDRVAIVLANGPEMAAAFLGVAAHASAAPLNPAYRVDEFAFYLEDLRASALILEASADGPAVEAAQRVGVPIIGLTPDACTQAPAASASTRRPARPRRATATARRTTRRWCCTPRAPRPGPRSCR